MFIPKFPGDKGHREQRCAPGQFESVSISKSGKYIRVLHQTEEKARKRLDGVKRRHTDLRFTDLRPRDKAGNLI